MKYRSERVTCHALKPRLIFPDPDLFLKSARLQRLPSSASDLASTEFASLRETSKDPFTESCACQRDGLTVIITACLTFATGVTVALIMQIYFGDPQVELCVCNLQLDFGNHVGVLRLLSNEYI